MENPISRRAPRRHAPANYHRATQPVQSYHERLRFVIYSLAHGTRSRPNRSSSPYRSSRKPSRDRRVRPRAAAPCGETGHVREGAHRNLSKMAPAARRSTRYRQSGRPVPRCATLEHAYARATLCSGLGACASQSSTTPSSLSRKSKSAMKRDSILMRW